VRKSFEIKSPWRKREEGCSLLVKERVWRSSPQTWEFQRKRFLFIASGEKLKGSTLPCEKKEGEKEIAFCSFCERGVDARA